MTCRGIFMISDEMCVGFENKGIFCLKQIMLPI
jgi:hypothetical protein